MKQHSLALIRALSLAALIPLSISCTFDFMPGFPDIVDYKPYEKTSLGRNILFFTINGEVITQDLGNYIRRMQFIKGGDLYWTKDHSYAAYNIDEGGYTTIRAILEEDSPYIELKMRLPSRDIVEGASYTPEVTLYCLYLPKVFERDSVGRRYIARYPVYHKAKINDAKITIDTYYPEGDSTGLRPYRPVLSGEFSFSGYYTDSLGRVVPIMARDGYFDVSNSPGVAATAARDTWKPLHGVVYEE